MKHYILNEEGEPEVCEDFHEWAKWFRENNKKRIVKQDYFGKYFVSTVFLALDHSFALEGEDATPILYETMVFNENHKEATELNETMQRYTTKELALKGHEEFVELLKTRK